MKRIVGTLAGLATLVVPPTAEAATPRGEIVVVSNGHAYGYVVLPARTTVDFTKATWITNSPVSMLFGWDGARSRGAGMWVAAGQHNHDYDFRTRNLIDPNRFEKGRTRLTMATRGPTTVRIPARGVKGRITVRLTNPLAAQYVVEPAVAATTTGSAVSNVTIDVRHPAWVVNGFVRDVGSTNSDVASQFTLCTADLEASGLCIKGGTIMASTVFNLSFTSPEMPWRPEGLTQASWTMASVAAAASWRHVVIAVSIG